MIIVWMDSLNYDLRAVTVGPCWGLCACGFISQERKHHNLYCTNEKNLRVRGLNMLLRATMASEVSWILKLSLSVPKLSHSTRRRVMNKRQQSVGPCALTGAHIGVATRTSVMRRRFT